MNEQYLIRRLVDQSSGCRGSSAEMVEKREWYAYFWNSSGAHIHVKYMTYHDDMLYAYVNSCHVPGTVFDDM